MIGSVPRAHDAQARRAAMGPDAFWDWFDGAFAEAVLGDIRAGATGRSALQRKSVALQTAQASLMRATGPQRRWFLAQPPPTPHSSVSGEPLAVGPCSACVLGPARSSLSERSSVQVFASAADDLCDGLDSRIV